MAAESSSLLRGDTATHLSAQQLLDCNPEYGCGGGWWDVVFNYAKGADVATYDAYPYVGLVQSCRITVEIGGVCRDTAG